MKKKIVSSILKVIAIVILLYGIWIFYDWRLWKEVLNSSLGRELKILMQILTLGFSGTLYGIATLIDNNKNLGQKKVKKTRLIKKLAVKCT